MKRLPHPKLVLVAIALISILGGGVGLALSILIDYRATQEDWALDLAVSARLVDEHLRGLHATGQAALLRMEDHMNVAWAASRRISDRERQWLDKVAAQLPFGVAACIHDDRSDPLLATSGLGMSACTAGQRERAALARVQPGRTVISALLDQRVGPRHLVVFSRVLPGIGPNAGLVTEVMADGEYFGQLYRSVETPDNSGLFLIARADGTTLARHPAPPGPVYRLEGGKTLLAEAGETPTGSYRSQSNLDGTERLMAYRRLADLDVVVAAGLPMPAVLRDWSLRTQRNAVLTLGAVILLLALGLVARAGLRQESALLKDMKEKASELSEALEEKDVLFQEVHHRVKNNLQVISSLITMQMLQVSDEAARAALKDALDRIASMGLVHQTLYEHNTAANVDLGVYFSRLAEALLAGYSARSGAVAVHVEVQGTLELERAVPLGLLANEALSNAFKHAFPEGGGTILISLSRDESNWHFSVRDDGIGASGTTGRGIGLSLIKALARQLNGRAAVSHDNGTVVVVTFPV